MPSSVKLVPTTPDRAAHLWVASGHDPAWPPELQPHAAWLNHVDESAIAELVGRGSLRTIECDGAIAGFVSKSVADPRFLPPYVQAMEAGTFLCSDFRGTGLNQQVKRLWLQEIFEQDKVDYCLLIVRESNARAMAALQNLNLSMTRSTPQSATPFSEYAKRKSWEHGHPCRVYSVSQSDYRRWIRRLRTP